MTLAELAGELNLNAHDVRQICEELQLPASDTTPFSAQQVLRITRHAAGRPAITAKPPGDSPAALPLPVHPGQGTFSGHGTVASLRADPGAAAAPPASSGSVMSGEATFGGAPTFGAAVAGESREAVDIEFRAFADRFDFLGELGVGGMGRVLKAVDRKLGREVAVKRINVGVANDPGHLARFVREAQIAARLNHSSLVALYDVLRDDDGPYLVMEYVEGESLASRLRRGRMPWQDAVALLLPVCEAVSHAHERGIIHRDIKPANILISPKGPPKLGDFGISRLLETADLTKSGSVLGTLDYMAPEQMDSARSVDARADIYSMAATLYHMVTGEVPRPINPDELPPELKATLHQELQRDPQNRSPSMRTFARQLQYLYEADGAVGRHAPAAATPTAIASSVQPVVGLDATQLEPGTPMAMGWLDAVPRWTVADVKGGRLFRESELIEQIYGGSLSPMTLIIDQSSPERKPMPASEALSRWQWVTSRTPLKLYPGETQIAEIGTEGAGRCILTNRRVLVRPVVIVEAEIADLFMTSFSNHRLWAMRSMNLPWISIPLLCGHGAHLNEFPLTPRDPAAFRKDIRTALGTGGIMKRLFLLVVFMALIPLWFLYVFVGAWIGEDRVRNLIPANDRLLMALRSGNGWTAMMNARPKEIRSFLESTQRAAKELRKREGLE